MLARSPYPETDRGPRASATATERLCIVSRAVKPVGEMLRFVIGPDGSVVPDVKRRLPGRGVWMTANRQVVAEAIRRQAFRRGFKAEVRVPADLVEMVENLLERAVLDALAIAHKSGQVAIGFSRVEAVLADHPVAALIEARDAAPDGVRKIRSAARHRLGERVRDVTLIGAFTSTQLNLALGRPNVVHAALLAGSASESVLGRWRTLERFRADRADAQAQGLCGEPVRVEGEATPDEGVRHPSRETPGLGSE
jgi:predicted RNA-binding protein YlxR (DUF448 family)